jgi:hypothetical protein
LFSNNHINELIIHRFDFSDEEVLAYYISFLKTLSLKLDRSTLQFFFNEAEQDFPLYTEAIKFFNHEESMIRIAVRTLTLNVYRVEDEAMRRYIINSTAVPYFSNIVWFIRQQCHTLDDIVSATTHENRRKLDDFVAEMLDHFYYLHDMLSLGIDSMNNVLSEHLLKYLFIPIFVGSLVGGASGETERISPVLALFLLAQVLTVFTHKPLITDLAQALIHPHPSNPVMLVPDPAKQEPPPPLTNLTKRTYYSSFRRFSSVPNLEALESYSMKASSAPPSPASTVTLAQLGLNPYSSRHNQMQPKASLLSPSTTDSKAMQTDKANKNSDGSAQSPLPPLRPLPEGNIYRDALLGFFEDDRMALNTLSMLHALIKNTAVDEELLEIGGLFPYRLTKARHLLEILTSSPSPPTTTPRGRASSRGKRSNRPSHHKRFVEKTAHGRSKSDTHAVIQALKQQASDKQLLRSADFPKKADIPSTDIVQLNNSTSNLARSQSLTEPIKSPAPGTPAQVIPSPTVPLVHDEVDIEVVDVGEVSSEDTISDREATESIGTSEPTSPLLSNEPAAGRNRTKTDTGVNVEDDKVLLSNEQQNVFTRQLIGRLLSLLVRSNQYRLVTLQMTLLTLRELVYSPDSPPRLTVDQLDTLEEAYSLVCSTLKERLGGVLGDIFLQLFDTEARGYKQVNFEYLIKDAALLLPVSGTPMSRLDLSRRLPSGEAEKTQKAIQQFLVLRELKYTLLRKKDDLLLTIQMGPLLPILQPKDPFVLENPLEYVTIPFMVYSGPNKKKVKRTLVLYKELFVVLDPSVQPKPPRPASPPPQLPPRDASSGQLPLPPPPASAPITASSTTQQTTTPSAADQKPTAGAAPTKQLILSGIIVHSAPMESLDLQIDHNDTSVLNVTSHPTTWRIEMVFEDSRKCEASFEILMKERNDIRARRMERIYTILGTNPDEVVRDIIKAEKEKEEATLLAQRAALYDGGGDDIPFGVEEVIHEEEGYEAANVTTIPSNGAGTNNTAVIHGVQSAAHDHSELSVQETRALKDSNAHVKPAETTAETNAVEGSNAQKKLFYLPREPRTHYLPARCTNRFYLSTYGTTTFYRADRFYLTYRTNCTKT